jgi:hypothetical protein
MACPAALSPPPTSATWLTPGSRRERALVEGDLVMMSAKDYAHEIVRNALTKAIGRALPSAIAMGAAMMFQFNDNTILEPDVAVFGRSSLVENGGEFLLRRAG